MKITCRAGGSGGRIPLRNETFSISALFTIQTKRARFYSYRRSRAQGDGVKVVLSHPTTLAIKDVFRSVGAEVVFRPVGEAAEAVLSPPTTLAPNGVLRSVAKAVVAVTCRLSGLLHSDARRSVGEALEAEPPCLCPSFALVPKAAVATGSASSCATTPCAAS